jgi:hypothetical protein
MMPVVRIGDATFAELKIISTWLGTETPALTVAEIVRQTMDRLGLERDEEPERIDSGEDAAPRQFDATPGLSFTRVLGATVNGAKVTKPRWVSLLKATVAQLKAKGLAGETLVSELRVPARVGRHDDDGFKHYPELGISLQGQSAADAWKEVDRIAKKWKIPVTVQFEWRQNPKAQFPGRTGSFALERPKEV